MDVGGRLPVAWFGFGFCSGLHERSVYIIAYIDKQSRYSWYNVFMIFAVKALRYVSLRLQSTMVQSWLKHRPKGVPPWGRRLAGHILHHTSNGPGYQLCSNSIHTRWHESALKFVLSKEVAC